MERMPVCISYAREDSAIVESIRERMEREAPGVGIWLDLTHMRAGAGWWQQVEEAIRKSEYLVLALSPASVTSPNVQREWRFARQRGKCVVPVMVSELALQSAPRWMRAVHWYRLDAEWDKFIQHLRSRCQEARVPFMAPALPEYVVERRLEFGKVKALLVCEEVKTITVALQGPGGYGKTTLAAALCHDEDLIETYFGGILWVTLGKAPDMLTTLTNLYGEFTGEATPFGDEAAASRALRERLEGRSCLVVVDNVWNLEHLKWFPAAATRLITTRDFRIAAQFEPVAVDEMRPAEAAKLLGQGLPGGFEGLAHRLGEWPLALELANRWLRKRLKRNQRVNDARRQLENQPWPEPDPLRMTIETSLEELDPAARQRYPELAIFPDDTPIPLYVLKVMWGRDAERLAEDLDDLGMIRLDFGESVVRVHDALRDWMKVSDMQALHGRLVDAWDSSTPYARRWAGYHLHHAGRDEDLRRLMLDIDWLHARLQAAGPQVLIADCEYVRLAQLQGALRLSAHALAKDTNQLASQMIGRLGDEALLNARQWRGAPWFRPLDATLVAPGGPLVRTLAGHTGGVTAVALTPDHRRAVSGSFDCTTKLWDLESGAEIRSFSGRTGWILAVAVSPDGQYLVTGSRDGTVRVWELDSGTEIRRIRAHSKDVRAVALAPNGRYGVSASDDATLKVWDFESGAVVHVLEGHTEEVTGVVLTPDGRAALSTSFDRTVRLWDLTSGVEAGCFPGERWAPAIAVTPDGGSAVSGYDLGAPRIWALKPGSEVRTFPGWHAVKSAAVTPDGRLAIFGSLYGYLHVWDLDCGTEIRTLYGHTGEVSVIVVMRGNKLATGSADKTVRVWDLNGNPGIPPRRSHSEAVAALAVIPGGRQAISASHDGTLKLWDLERRAEVRSLRGHRSWVTSVAASPDGHRVLSGGWNDVVKAWDLDSGDEIRSFPVRNRWTAGVAITPDGRGVVCVDRDQTLKLLDFQSGAEIRSFGIHKSPINAVAVTSDGRRVVTASRYGLIVWDLQSGAELRRLRGATTALALTSDGRHVLAPAWLDVVKLWDLHSGAELRSYAGHSDKVKAVALTPDGRRFISGSDDRTVRLWEVETGRTIARFDCDGAVTACAFLPDSATVIAGDALGNVHFLRLEN